MPIATNNSVFFSIIIPTYNSAAFIDKCLDSIICQTFKDYEIIIYDGLSEDGTLEQVNSAKKENPAVQINVYSEQDTGVYDAMNKAITKSKGQWLYFLGGDDRLFDSDTLQRVSRQNLKGNVVYGNVKMIYSEDVYNGPYTLGKILFENNICHQAIFYNRTVFEKIGFYNTEYRIYADYDFNIRCFLDGSVRLHYINEVIAWYNEREGLTGRNTPDLAFHNRREEYRKAYGQSIPGRFYPILKLFRNNLEKLKHKLSMY